MATDVRWGAAMCILPQTGFGVPNTLILAAGEVAQTVLAIEGPILGVRDAGTGESGITIPTHARQAIERPPLPSSFSEIQNAFERVEVSGLSIAFPLQGNGVTSAAAAGEAQPLEGIDAVFQAAGLKGASNGTAWEYTASPTTVYASIRIFLGSTDGATTGLAYTYLDCLVDTLDIPNVGGESTVVTANFSVGSLLEVQELQFPSPIAYGTQATLSPPTNQDATFIWNTERCHQTFTVNIANTVEEFSCSNAANGKRLDQSDRRISANGSVYSDSTGGNIDFEYLELVDTSGSLANATWSYGDSSSVRNHVAFECNNLQVDDLSYDKAGSLTTAEVNTHCTAEVVADDLFKLTFD
jgi:hypothetical protein